MKNVMKSLSHRKQYPQDIITLMEIANIVELLLKSTLHLHYCTMAHIQLKRKMQTTCQVKLSFPALIMKKRLLPFLILDSNIAIDSKV